MLFAAVLERSLGSRSWKKVAMIEAGPAFEMVVTGFPPGDVSVLEHLTYRRPAINQSIREMPPDSS